MVYLGAAVGALVFNTPALRRLVVDERAVAQSDIVRAHDAARRRGVEPRLSPVQRVHRRAVAGDRGVRGAAALMGARRAGDDNLRNQTISLDNCDSTFDDVRGRNMPEAAWATLTSTFLQALSPPHLTSFL